MTWICPHEDRGRCERRHAPCKPGQPGCVLAERKKGRPRTNTASPKAVSSRLEDEGGTCREELIAAMKTLFGTDRRRIDHALKVLEYAESILEEDPGEAAVVVPAAILHDIGIHEAESRHGSSAGKYQEMEGPPIARRIMRKLKLRKPVVDHVCRIVANHHSARDIDTPEFRIVWDADWLVNFPEECPGFARSRRARAIDRIFRTEAGRRMAIALFLK